MVFSNKTIMFFSKVYAKSSVYLSIPEALDISDNLTPSERTMYITVKGMMLSKPDVSILSTAGLARACKLPAKTVTNVRSTLRKKGYLLINFYRDHEKLKRADVVIGKEPVELYNAGIRVDITSIQAYTQVRDRLRFDDPKMTAAMRNRVVEEINSEYKE